MTLKSLRIFLIISALDLPETCAKCHMPEHSEELPADLREELRTHGGWNQSARRLFIKSQKIQTATEETRTSNLSFSIGLEKSLHVDGYQYTRGCRSLVGGLLLGTDPMIQ